MRLNIGCAFFSLPFSLFLFLFKKNSFLTRFLFPSQWFVHLVSSKQTTLAKGWSIDDRYEFPAFFLSDIFCFFFFFFSDIWERLLDFFLHEAILVYSVVFSFPFFLFFWFFFVGLTWYWCMYIPHSLCMFCVL